MNIAEVIKAGVVDPDSAYEIARDLAHEVNEIAYISEWAKEAA